MLEIYSKWSLFIRQSGQKTGTVHVVEMCNIYSNYRGGGQQKTYLLGAIILKATVCHLVRHNEM